MKKYNSEYLQLGLTEIGSEDEPKPQCIICLEIICNENIKPSKLYKEALVAKHLSEYMKTTLEEVVKIINFIKLRPLQPRFFKFFIKIWEASSTLKFDGFFEVRFFSKLLS